MSSKSYVTVNEKKQLEIKIGSCKLWSEKKLPLNKIALNAQLQNVLDPITDPNSNALFALLSGLLANQKEQTVKMRNEITDLRTPITLQERYS